MNAWRSAPKPNRRVDDDVPAAGDALSYAGKVTVGFLTDAGLVPDPQALADAARAETLALTAGNY